MATLAPVSRFRLIVTSVLLLSFLLLILFSGLRSETISHAQEERSPSAVRFSENFDGVNAPALPFGWTTSRTGSNSLFVTTTLSPDTAPNALFTNNPATAGSAEITSPNITLGNSRARLTFRHSYQTEFRRGYDGGVLEISVNGAAFQDILAAGAAFFAGGYIQSIIPEATGNSLLGRQAWTGDSAGYTTTIVDLPLSLANQSVRLRWRYATDATYEGGGWRIDRVLVEDLAPVVVRYQENFDSLQAPALPPHWTTEQTDPVRAFRTHTETTYTAPNSIFTPAMIPSGTAAIISPIIRIGANSPKLIFQHHYATEAGEEGGVLEISINGGAFRDILAAGGSFVHGGYSGTLTDQDNPLVNRQSWTGATLGFIITEVNLPPSAYRQNVRFKWIFGTDNFIPSIGWWIDAVRVIDNLSGQNLNAIAIPETGLAQPYPSEIQVEGHEGLITSVQVNLVNFTHNSPDDVDLVLVSPSGRKVVLMSDVGGNNPVSNLSLTFDDTSSASLPDNAQLVSGNYKPTNFEPGDIFPAPAPLGAPTGNTLGVLNGSEANGLWKLFLVDDNGASAGNISGGWSLDVQTAPNVVVIPASGAAQPYPAEFIVSDHPGAVSKVTVNLINFSHLSPDDADLMLVAPNGRRVVLMSDVGGDTEVGALNITLDDDALSSLPDNAPLASGTFKPTNFEVGDTFPLPAPQGTPTGTTLNHFFGTEANGIWKLYVVDDTGENFGSLAGNFSLTIQSSTGVCQFNLSQTVQPFPISGGTGNFGINIAGGCPWQAASEVSFITINSSSSGEGSGTISFSVEPNMGVGRTGTIIVSGGGFTRTFSVQQSSGCPFTLSQDTLNFGGGGGSGNVGVTAAGMCGWISTTDDTWITIQSGSGSGNGTVTFTVAPNTTANPRTGTIQIGARLLTINQARAISETPFDFDGDAKADLSVFRPANSTWYVSNSSNGSLLAQQFGLSTDRIVPADYDGDNRADISVFRGGTWYTLSSINGSLRTDQWGTSGDIAVPADYDGDSKADLAVWRESTGTFYILSSLTSSVRAEQFGASGDRPVIGDFDGDSKADLAIFRSSTATFYIRSSSNGAVRAQQFGASADKPIAVDFDGDGKTEIAVYRPSTGAWYMLQSSDNNFRGINWGANGDIPSAGDYDGDAKCDVAVFRPSTGTFYILQSATNSLRAEQFGASGDVPIASAYVP